jgi:hypothetical protein
MRPESAFNRDELRHRRDHIAAEPIVYTLDEVMLKIPGLSRSKLFEELGSGRLPSVKIGKRRFVRPRDLDAWLEDRATEQAVVPIRAARGRKRAAKVTEAAKSASATARRPRGPKPQEQGPDTVTPRPKGPGTPSAGATIVRLSDYGVTPPEPELQPAPIIVRLIPVTDWRVHEHLAHIGRLSEAKASPHARLSDEKLGEADAASRPPHTHRGAPLPARHQ